MSFWEKIQKDIKKNIKDGLTIVKEGSAVVSQKIEKLTVEGKRKYKLLTLNMRVQDEFARLGGKVFDLSLKTKNPMSNKKIIAIISKIKELEAQITTLEKKHRKRRVVKPAPKRKSPKKKRRTSLKSK